MYKKILTAVLTFALCFSTVPATASANEWDDYMETGENENNYTSEEPEPDPYITEEPDEACSIGPEDLCVTPAKKHIVKGTSFKINVAIRPGSIFEELTDEEWDALYEHDVSNVEFKSSKPSIAKVNSVTGKVTGKKKGTCRITTTIYFLDGTEWPLRTTVYVSR